MMIPKIRLGITEPAVTGGLRARLTGCAAALVGLHIVYKTPSRPQWIWSTFRHVDNVPELDDRSGRSFTFHNGDPSTHMTDEPEPEEGRSRVTVAR